MKLSAKNFFRCLVQRNKGCYPFSNTIITTFCSCDHDVVFVAMVFEWKKTDYLNFKF